MLRDAPETHRLILRARPAAQIAAAGPLGFSLPVVPCRAATGADAAALWLGPDEWLLLTPTSDLARALGRALDGLPHSLVDVGHRQVGLVLEGPHAADMLSAGCPLDMVDAFPVGMCTRTVFAKAEIVLWRTGPDEWRIEVWRSFAPYLRGLLAEAAREFAVAA